MANDAVSQRNDHVGVMQQVHKNTTVHTHNPVYNAGLKPQDVRPVKLAASCDIFVFTAKLTNDCLLKHKFELHQAVSGILKDLGAMVPFKKFRKY